MLYTTCWAHAKQYLNDKSDWWDMCPEGCKYYMKSDINYLIKNDGQLP